MQPHGPGQRQRVPVPCERAQPMPVQNMSHIKSKDCPDPFYCGNKFQDFPGMIFTAALLPALESFHEGHPLEDLLLGRLSLKDAFL